MNPDIFAEWFRRQGHSIIRTETSFWTNSGPRVYQAFPYHWQIEPSEDELRRLWDVKAIGLRYSSPLSAPTGRLSYHVLFRGDTYEIEGLQKKARYDVRKGLEYATYEPISCQRLAVEGWAIREDTLARQGRMKAETQEWWNRLCSSADGLPGFEAWGALRNGQLIASLLAFTCDDCFYILYQQSLAEHLKYGVNNALAYVVTRSAVCRPEINQVFYGLHSLDAPPSVDNFKFRMNYSAVPVRQCVVFHPWVAPLVNTIPEALIKRAAQILHSPKLAKMEGMIRFSREGKRPLHEQLRPQPLKDVSF